MDKISQWFAHNKLIINEGKTVALNFRNVKERVPETINIQLSNKAVNRVATTKFLGIWVQDNVRWETHIDYLNKKLNSLCYVLRVLESCCSKECLRSVYFANVQSLLKYGVIFWGGSPNSTKLFRGQKRIIRIIEGVTPRQSCKPLFKKLQILPLPCLHIYETVVFIKQYALEKPTLFLRNKDIHTHNTRHKMDLHTHQTKTSLCKSGVPHLGKKYLDNCLKTYN